MPSVSQLDAAIKLANDGFPVFPCSYKKSPMVQNGFHAATTDIEQIRKWWTDNPNALIGIPTGQATGILVLDVDDKPEENKDGISGLRDLTEQYGALPETYTVRSANGGHHYYYQLNGEEVRNSASLLAPGVDIRANGGYIISPPGRIKGKSYLVESGSLDNLTPVPEWLLLAIQEAKAGKPDATKDGKPVCRNNALAEIGIKCRLAGLKSRQIETVLLDENHRFDEPLEEAEVKTIAKGMSRYRPNLPKLTRAYEFLKDRGNIRLNTFSGVIELDGEPMENDAVAGQFALELERIHAKTFSSRLLHEACGVVAYENKYDPLSDYLLGLKWDGVARLESMLFEALGCTMPDFPNHGKEYVGEIGKRFMVGAVSRALVPGCQHRMVPVFIGQQNQGKSKFLGSLVPNSEWFTDQIPKQLTDKAASEAVIARWIVEWGEMAGLRRNEVEDIKSYLSRRAEKYRPAYGRFVLTYLRRCVIACTTNKRNVLPRNDENLRFWPVLTGKFDEQYMTSQTRDQLWAEAVQVYQEGFRWWEASPGFEAQLNQAREDATDHDAWLEVLEHALIENQRYTTADIWENILSGGTLAKCSRADEMRISDCMRALGWRKKQDNDLKRRWERGC